MAEGEFEIRNKYGDVVQRGEIHVEDVHETSDGSIVELRFDEPARLRRREDGSDRMSGHVDLRDIVE